MNIFYVIAITALAAAFATSFAEYKLNYNLVDFAKDHVLAFLSRLPFIGKLFAAALLIAGMLMLGAQLSHASTVAQPKHQVGFADTSIHYSDYSLEAIAKSCCGLPPPCPGSAICPVLFILIVPEEIAQDNCCGLPPPPPGQPSANKPAHRGLIHQSWRHAVKPAAKAGAKASRSSARAGSFVAKKSAKGVAKAAKAAAKVLY